MRPTLRRTAWSLAVLLASGAQIANAQAFRTNAGFTTNTLPANDDGSTGLVNLGFQVNFFGVNRTQTYVNNNGNITFDSPLSTFTPFNLLSTSRQIIAPYFMDIDTRGALSAPVRYGQSTVNGRAAFGVNWDGVGYFQNGDNRLNIFQLVLLDRGDTGAGNFDFEFNFTRILTESGGASGDNNPNDGICQPTEPNCAPARSGYSNGSTVDERSFEIAGSGVRGALIDGGPNALVSGRLNTDVTGRYLFNVRAGQVLPPPTTVPEPTTVVLLGTGGLALGMVARRRARRQ